MKPLTAFGAIVIALLCTIARPALADTLRTGNLMKCVDSAVNGPPRWDLSIMGHRFTCHKIRVATEAEAKRARTYNPNNAFYKGNLIHALRLRPDDNVYYTITLENWATDCKILMPDMQIDRGALSRIGMKVPAFLRPGYALTKDVERRLMGSWEATAEMVVMASVDKWADSQPQCKRAWSMAADAVPLAPAAPAAQPPSAANAEIRTGAGLCLDVHTPEMSTNGGRVQVWACHGGPQQRWTYDSAAHSLRNSGGLCLDVQAGINQNGNRVQVWSCNGQWQQQWTPLADGSLRNAGGLCLDAHAPDQATNGGRVQIWQCNGSQQQRFTITGQSSNSVPPRTDGKIFPRDPPAPPARAL